MPYITRILFCLCLLSPVSGFVLDVPPAVDLQADALLVRDSGRPLLVIVTQRFCSYCRILDREIIQPMLISGDYDDKVIFRELRIDAEVMVTDFEGERIAAGDLAARYKEWLTPTLLFLGPDGEELTERIRGLGTLDFFAFYVDKAIAKAREQLKQGS